MSEFFKKYGPLFWVAGGLFSLSMVFKTRAMLKRQAEEEDERKMRIRGELPRMRALPHRSGWKNLSGFRSFRSSIRRGFDKREKPQFGPGRKIFHPSNYPFLVITPTNRIESGWDFREDARDHIKELSKEDRKKVRIVTQRTAKALGIDPTNQTVWTKGETDLAGRRS
jgi:hypothetical protein